ncbi:hypothetical protein [Celeribacter halophilus]|uniref:Uncharacterized protein n=1 Tax=Celeribacter halophilus TaxID=576117 RepID=A0A1I3X8U7_9RHOB|nr:hypothetical protein [Celeribacter halophilus]PZX03809.1 hypothetical protein LX82_03719 [Celeribacter halophilus]SFK16024.1 hypothetical protein SAMN04488138_1444 [Celeribacter halophilus]
MTYKITALSAVAALLIPASVLAQDAVAVAMGASFTTVSMTETFTTDDVDITIPGQDLQDGTAFITTPFGPVSLPVTGHTDDQVVTVPGQDTTITTDERVLSSISVAAASGDYAAASSTANSAATGANSGSSMVPGTVITATTEPTPGGAFTSSVMVGTDYLN